MRSAILLICIAPLLSALEVATGPMLGPDYDQRAFYVRAGGQWKKTYTGGEYRTEAQGKIMNLRLAQGLFHDEWLKERPFNPDENVNSLIAALDFYKRHGVLMINVSLQGGQAGYDPNVNGIARQNGYKFGAEKGTYVSAFMPNGELKPAWMQRLARLLQAADRRGMLVNLMYFYQGQDESLQSTEALHAAARNITSWLIRGKFRNVIIDVANEYDLRTGWDHDRYIPNKIIPLVEEVRSQFRKAGFMVPVSASSDGRMEFPEELMQASDYILIHGNNKTAAQKRRRAAELKDVAKPVLMNEDDNGRDSTVENLAKELESCDIFFDEAAGWGYMPWVQAQRFPFRFMPAPSVEVRNQMPEKERDLAYFHAVLEHIAERVLRRAPHAGR